MTEAEYLYVGIGLCLQTPAKIEFVYIEEDIEMAQLEYSEEAMLRMPRWQARLAHIVNSSWFNNLIIIVIITAGVTVGVETYESFAAQNHTILNIIEQAILAIFVVEIVIKIAAEGSRPWRYFLNPWNIFDFAIVSASLLPVGGQYLAVLRLIRILRVFKLVKAIPKLQIIVEALLRSIPSMGYVSILVVDSLLHLCGVGGLYLRWK